VDSTILAPRISAGLSARLRPGRTLAELWWDVCERGTEDDELVLRESLRELFRPLPVSWEGLDCFRRSTFRASSGLMPVLDPLDVFATGAGGLAPDRADEVLAVDAQDAAGCPRAGRMKGSGAVEGGLEMAV